MPNKIINFEILELDDKAPEVVNYYAVRIERTSLYLRVSVDESVSLYYKATLRGSPKPTMDDIMKKNKSEPVWTSFGTNFSFQAAVTQDYIYNDVYIDL